MRVKQKQRRVLAVLMAVFLVLTGTNFKTAPVHAAEETGVLTPEQAIALKNGDFSNGKKNWNCFAMEWEGVGANAVYTPGREGMKIAIGNPGSLDWHIYLAQKIRLFKGNRYTVSFDIVSDIDRKAGTSIEYEYDTNWKMLDESFQLQAGQKQSLSYEFDASDDFSGNFLIKLGKNAGETYGAHEVTVSNVRVEVAGYRDSAVLTADGTFTDGAGAFALHTKDGGVAAADTTGKYYKAVVAAAGQQPDSVEMERAGLQIKEGGSYELTFGARADRSRQITVSLSDGSHSYLQQTAIIDEVTGTYRFPFTADRAGTASLKLLLGNPGTDTGSHELYFDNISVALEGAKEALGTKEAAYDMLLADPPSVSEDPEHNVAGNDLTLTFEPNAAYQNAVRGVVVDGVSVPAGQFTIGRGSVTISKNRFTQEKVYDIEVRASGYEAAKVSQMVYADKLWQLSWNDEFNGSSVDETKWAYQEGTGTEYGLTDWGNNEQQYYTRDNIAVRDGNLVLTADDEGRNGKPYTSGRVWTSGKFEGAYGKFEAKIKMPEGEGLWPAFWMVPADTEYGAWAASGEIDIMEAKGRLTEEVGSTIHFGGVYPENRYSSVNYNFGDGEDITGYHIYSLEWEPGEMRWYVDGQLYHTENSWNSRGVDEAADYAYPAPFDKPFVIILNLAVGGTFDGNRLPEITDLPAYMQVDYVRAYDLVGREPIPAVQPVLPKEDIPAGAKQPVNGNYVTDNNFADVKIVKEAGGTLDPVRWNLSTMPEYGGAAQIRTENADGSAYAVFEITNPGTQLHSIQFIQKLPLVKGRYYRLSFDAQAEESRSMQVKIGSDESRNFTVYSGSYAPELTNETSHYSYQFQMTQETDTAARLEFNMGQNDSIIRLANVKLEEVDGLYTEDGVKTPLKSGNQIYNGTFDQGTQDRMTFWQVNGGSASVDPQARELKVVTGTGNRDAVTVVQGGMEYLKNDTYRLTFDAKADADREITVKFTDSAGSTVYGSRNISLNTAYGTYEAEFTMPDHTDKNGRVIFEVGGAAGTVTLDQVALKRTTYLNYDFSETPMYPLRGGTFDMGTGPWTSYGVSFAADNGRLKASPSAGGNRWDKLLSYDGLVLAPGLDYVLSFDISASGKAAVDVTMEDGNYYRVKQFLELQATPEGNHYEFEFRMDSRQTVALKFLLGGAAAGYDFYLDNIKLAVKNAPLAEPSYLQAAEKTVAAGEPIELILSGAPGFAAAIDKVRVGSTTLPAGSYRVENGRLVIDGAAVNFTGNARITVSAAGYEESNTVTLRTLPSDGNLVENGSFDTGMAGWGNYFHNGCASVQAGADPVTGNTAAEVTVNWHENADWNAILLQEGIPLNGGKTYELTFEAHASAARPLRAIIKNTAMTGTVNLTTASQNYSILFQTDSDMTAELQFLMGYIDNGGIQTPTGTHQIYISNVCLRESDGTPAPVYPKISGVKNGEIYKTPVTPSVRYEGEYDMKLYRKAEAGAEYQEIAYASLQQLTEDGFYKFMVSDRTNPAIRTNVEFELNSYVDLSKDYYIIKSRANSKVFQAAGSRNGALLVQAGYTENLNQLFTKEEISGGYFKLRNLVSGRVLEVEDASKANSAPLVLSDDTGAKSQQWKAVYTNQGYYKLVNRASGKVVDVPGAVGTEGLALKQYEDNGSNAQQWDIVRMDVQAILNGQTVPDTGSAESWKQNAITYPAADNLTPAGPVYIKWQNVAGFAQASGYEVYVDGNLLGTVAANGKEASEYEYYTTEVKKHTVAVKAILSDGSSLMTEPKDFYVSKKGVGWSTLYRTQDMGLSWYYHWATEPSAGTDPKLQFVPMIWGNWGSAWLSDPANEKYRTVLGFNEPDFAEQSNVKVEEALAAWPEFMKSGLRLGSPASAIPASYSVWFEDFMNGITADPALDVDFIAFHCYLDSTDGNAFLKLIDDCWEKYKKPIWITEFGVAAWGEENANKFNKEDVYNNFMSVVLPGLDARPYVERYAWFPFDPNDAYGGASGIFNYDTGKLNELGLLYRSLGIPEGFTLPPLDNTDPDPDPDPDPTPEPAVIHLEAENYSAMEGVAKEACSEGGENVSYIDPGDWMEYRINAKAEGEYMLKVRASSPYEETGILSVMQDGRTLGSASIAKTGGWQDWRDFTGNSFSLRQGEQTIRLFVTGGRYNLNWIELVPTGNQPEVPDTDTEEIRIEAETYTAMEGVQSEACGDTGGGQNVGWIDAGDWLEYRVMIPKAGQYTVDYRINGWNNDARLQLLHGDTVLNETAVYTGNSWTLVPGGTISLPAGELTLRVKVMQGGFNFNWMELKKVK